MEETKRVFPKIFSKLLERITLTTDDLDLPTYEKNCSSSLFIKFATPISTAGFPQLFLPTVPVPAVSTICT